MNRWARTVSCILLGLFVGSIASLIYISYHDIAKNQIKAKLVETFEQNYDCRFDGSIEYLNIFTLSCNLKDITVTPSDCSNNDWSIYIHSCSINLSWVALLWDHIFLMNGRCEQLVMHETFTDQPYQLTDFLKKVSTGPGAHLVQYDTLAIIDGVLSLSNVDGSFHFTSSYIANMAQDGEFVQSHIYMNDGRTLLHGRNYIDQLNGSIRCRMPYALDSSNLYLHTDLKMRLPDLQGQEDVVLFGEFDDNKGRFIIENKKGLFTINPINLQYSKSEALVSMSMIVTPKLLNVLHVPEQLQKKIQGNCLLSASADLYKLSETIKAKLSIDKIVYNELEIFNDFTATVQHDGTNYIADVVAGDMIVSGPMNFDRDNFHAHFSNIQDVSLLKDQWKIDANQAIFKIDANKKTGATGSYDLYATRKYQAEPVHLSGSFSFDQDAIKLNGQLGGKEYELYSTHSPFCLHRFVVHDDDTKLINFYADQKNPQKLLGEIDFNYVKSLLTPAWKPSFTQDGSFLFEGEIKKGVYHAHVHTHDAHIRLPRVYNVIQSFDASVEIDFSHRSTLFKNISCDLYEGDISCKQARIIFNENGKISFVHAPLLFKDVMLSGYKGIFSTFSGKLHCEKRKDNPFLLSGFLIAEKSQLKGNILSKEFQDQVMGDVDYAPSMNNNINCDFDIHMMTREGVDVQTSFINTDLRGKIDLTGSLQKPKVDGAINLNGGHFAFPYKSLDIMSGKITCLPGKTFEPFIEVVARGKLKRYEVTMRVLGSISDQKISFESVPHLEESQIIGLLLVGSEDNSLSNMVPAFLTQSLQDLVFGPAMSKSNLKKMFDTLLKPFKRVRIMPQFSNQSGRGGVRGILEIDVTDKLSGRIDSNFAQLEDTQFEVNYAATDEVTFRVLKDGPSTYGGEVEMRWSFNKIGK